MLCEMCFLRVYASVCALRKPDLTEFSLASSSISICLLFSYSQILTFFFSHITQHNIQNITKHNNRHILNISRSNQKGGREGRTIKTQKSFLYTITYIHQKTLPSINGRGPHQLAPLYIHTSLFAGGYGSNMFFYTCGVNQFCIIVFFTAVKPANNILFCIE